jgi:hypothetical protein
MTSHQHTGTERFEAAEIANLRQLQGQGLSSAVGEYTPPEFWEALDTIERLHAALASRDEAVHQHPDDEAVDRFAARMKWKLAKARAKGRSGWQDRAWTPEAISQALREHVEKGDPTDVANYCMFLAARNEPIYPAAQQPRGQAVSDEAVWQLAVDACAAACCEQVKDHPSINTLTLANYDPAEARTAGEIGMAGQCYAAILALRDKAPHGQAVSDADVLTRAIQRLNVNPYSMTKQECITLLQELRDDILARRDKPDHFPDATKMMQRAPLIEYKCGDCGAAGDEKKSCWCQTCHPVTLDDMRMVLRPDCGNKRCPKANDHRNACTNSNEPGQPGSAA